MNRKRLQLFAIRRLMRFGRMTEGEGFARLLYEAGRLTNFGLWLAVVVGVTAFSFAFCCEFAIQAAEQAGVTIPLTAFSDPKGIMLEGVVGVLASGVAVGVLTANRLMSWPVGGPVWPYFLTSYDALRKKEQERREDFRLRMDGARLRDQRRCAELGLQYVELAYD